MTTAPTNRPNRFGLLGGDMQGFPNGRRLGDDVGAITIRMLMGEPAGPSPYACTPSPRGRIFGR
ncbi:hypothetical protein H4W80_006514 [Nonomuraea angiospora]|uniref:Uncharacterized protein n=2 Tax=Nonomuraea angiospora TaxID=46172 RepID=A0ABR9M5R7_9ACTN|nr:hypothetical protein [Nonomuraea angiospora]